MSAALMPFNVNPKWFGLTQAQERRAGIDSMVKSGGRLFIFQFKACLNSGSLPCYKVEKLQCSVLTKFTKRHSNSTFYVFPSLSSVMQANNSACLLADSYLVPADSVNQFFNKSYKTRTIYLNTSHPEIYTNRPKHSENAIKSCSFLGCVCKNLLHICFSNDNGEIKPHLLITSKSFESQSWEGFLAEIDGGIEIQNEDSEHSDIIIKSADDFERILEEFSGKKLGDGLYGMFIPSRNDSQL